MDSVTGHNDLRLGQDGQRVRYFSRAKTDHVHRIRQQGPALFYVDNDGTRMKGDVFSVGSGSTFAYGVLDQEYHWDLTVEEALDLGKRSIYAAGHRDAFSGNSLNLFHVKETGWECTFPSSRAVVRSLTGSCSHWQLRLQRTALRYGPWLSTTNRKGAGAARARRRRAAGYGNVCRVEEAMK